jgi:hypothetical protein
MQTGQDFLRAQVNNSIMQHQALLTAVREHMEHGDAPPFRALCARHVPILEHHQRLLEAYAHSIGTPGGGTIKNVVGAVLEKARDLAESFRDSDFLRVVGDVVMIRQSQDTFNAFAHAGDHLHDAALAELGRGCAHDHDTMQREFNTYAVSLFVDLVRSGDGDASAASAGTHDLRVVGGAA